MADLVEISAEVSGDDGFFFWEGRKFGNLSPEQLAMLSGMLGEMAAVAQTLGLRGPTGDLKATLTAKGIPGVQESLVVEGFSKDDMTRFQHRFSDEWGRLIEMFGDRRRGRGARR